MATQRLRGRAAVARRARWLSEHPLCTTCMLSGRIAAATEVDHVIAIMHGGPDDDSNLQSLCAPCHARKTDSDLDRVGKAGADAHGMPTDPDHPWHK